MHRVKVTLLISMVLMIVASACQVGLPSPASAPVIASPVSGLDVVDQVQKPAFTATRIGLTVAPSKTMTPFPSITPLPATPTETPFGFVASNTPTEEIIPTTEPPDPDEGATDDWGSPTRCSLISKTPSNWTVIGPGAQTKASWTLLNSGTEKWQANEMVLVYYDGAKLTLPDNKKTTLPRDVRVGQTVTASILITAPKLPGHYKSVWALRLNSNDRVFCTFTIKIFVQ